MTEPERPKWPSELPAPIEIGKAVKMHYMSPDELTTPKAFSELTHDMFWFSEDKYFIFTKANESLGQELSDIFESYGIEPGPIERCFYPHPNSCYKNDYIHLAPGSIEHDWHKDAANKQEHTRFTLSLATWKQKEMQIAYTAEASAKAIEKPTPLVSVKPGIFGFSIDLIAAFKRWRKRDKNA